MSLAVFEATTRCHFLQGANKNVDFFKVANSFGTVTCLLFIPFKIRD